MSPPTSSAPHYPTSATLPISVNRRIYADLSLASSRSAHSCTRPPHARGAQEWWNTQWTFGYMRYMDESYVEGGCANKSCESFRRLGANPLYGIDSDCDDGMFRTERSSSDYQRYMWKETTYVMFYVWRGGFSWDSRKGLMRGLDQIPTGTRRDYRPREGSTIKRTARQL